MGDRRGVVVGIDGSEESRQALAFALQDAARRGTGVRVISVFLPPQYRLQAYWLTAPPTVDQVKDDLRATATRMIDEVVAEHPGLAPVPVELHELEGHPAKVLIDEARGVDLLVVGSPWPWRLRQRPAGIVGLQYVLHGECPVTVVRSAVRPATTGERLEGSAEPARRGARGVDPALEVAVARRHRGRIGPRGAHLPRNRCLHRLRALDVPVRGRLGRHRLRSARGAVRAAVRTGAAGPTPRSSPGPSSCTAAGSATSCNWSPTTTTPNHHRMDPHPHGARSRRRGPATR